MKINQTILLTIFLAQFLLPGPGCSGGNGPSTPAIDDQTGTTARFDQSQGSHMLLDFSYISVDVSNPGNIQYEIIPVRDIQKHWNILTFLENGPCTNCFKLTGITPSGNGTLYVDVEVSGPFANPNLTGFDVRGIAMFNASLTFLESGLTLSDMDLGDGAVIDPDGYTTLYNSTTLGSGPGGLEGYKKGKFATATAPDGLLNGYMRFTSSDPTNTRNAFLAGDAVTVTYEIKMPGSGFIFGYALDANWAPPIVNPVIDPMTDFPADANCSEPYKIIASSGSINPFGDAVITIDVYDWQGKTSHGDPVIECPGLFNGIKTATFVLDGAGFTRYSLTVSNELSALAGAYKCLISVEDNDNDPLKPWLGLTAYQVVEINVSSDFNLTEVTPPDLNTRTYDYEVLGNHLFIASAHNGVQIYDISDPLNPVWFKNVPINGITYDLAINNGYL